MGPQTTSTQCAGGRYEWDDYACSQNPTYIISLSAGGVKQNGQYTRNWGYAREEGVLRYTTALCVLFPVCVLLLFEMSESENDGISRVV